MKALDIVRTPNGSIAIITSTTNNGTMANIRCIGGLNTDRLGNFKCAWWYEKELEIIDSIPRILAKEMAGIGEASKEDAETLFAIK